MSQIARLHLRPFAVAVATFALLFGCATPEQRISRHPEMFATLPMEHQSLVRQGMVVEGMSMDAVYLAWGSPDRYRESSGDGRRLVTWLYLGYQTEVLPSYSWVSYGGRYCDYRYRYPVYDPVYVNVPYLYRTAMFEEGRLVGHEAPLAQGGAPVPGIPVR